MKTYEQFMLERIDNEKPKPGPVNMKPFDTNRKDSPVSSRTGLGLNQKAAKQVQKQRAAQKAQTGPKSFLGAIKSNPTGAVNTQSKAPSFKAASPNVNYSSKSSSSNDRIAPSARGAI